MFTIFSPLNMERKREIKRKVHKIESSIFFKVSLFFFWLLHRSSLSKRQDNTTELVKCDSPVIAFGVPFQLFLDFTIRVLDAVVFEALVEFLQLVELQEPILRRIQGVE